MQESSVVLLLDVNSLKNPLAQTAHSGCALAEPAAFVYLPGGHLMCAAHDSTRVPRLEETVLKNPKAHTSHLGCAEEEPTTAVYFPGGHLA